jgi:hypothetical protein
MTTTTNLGIDLIETNQTQKEVTANAATTALEAALTDAVEIEIEDGSNAVADADFRDGVALVLTDGGVTAAFDVVLPALKGVKAIINTTGEDATIACEDAASGAEEATIPAGTTAIVYCDGTQVWQLTADLSSAVEAFTDLPDAPSSYSGQGGKLLAVNSGATAVEFVAAPYDIGTFVAGSPEADEVVLRFVATRAFTLPAGLSGSQVKAGTAADDATDFDVKKGASSVGTISFAASGDTATFTMASATSFTAGDILSIVAPSTPDATLADISFTLAGTRD